MPIIAWEFYSGIGGLHLALHRSNVDGTVSRAFDWDQTACKVYEANWGPKIVKKVDIASLTALSLLEKSPPADLWLLSPSCQPYTVLNPLAKGEQDPRARSFLHLVQSVLPSVVGMGTGAHPTRLLVENVAGFETSSTRQILLDTLHSLGYNTMEFLLTPLQFGIPNSRLRYYLLAKMAPLAFPTANPSPSPDHLWRHIPGYQASDWQDPREHESDLPIKPLRQFLDDDASECAVPDRVLQKWGRLFDIVLPSSTRTCCFTRGYTQLVERAGSILQLNEELDTTTIFDQFLEAQKDGDPLATQILPPLRLRYFSPTELLRLFYFLPPADAAADKRANFVWPESVSTKVKYRLIGNSVNVLVVTKLIDFLYAE